MRPLYSSLQTSQGLTIRPILKDYEMLPRLKEIVGSTPTVPEENWICCPHIQRDILHKNLMYYIEKDPWPIPATEDREAYHGDRHLEWWCSGLLSVLEIERLYQKYSQPIKDNDVFFELGCSTGRILRHAAFQSACKLKTWGCDINARSVDWVQQFLPKNLVVFQNTALPTLPLPDNSVDIITGCSIFTHIDDLESAWLMELSRILKPTGIAFVTIMSEKYWAKLNDSPQYTWVKPMLLSAHCEYPLASDSFEKPMPAKRITLSWPGSVYNTTIFHHSDYIHGCWGRYVDILDIMEQGIDIQDLVIFRKY